MAKIEIVNDGKKKRQSWEAHLTIENENFNYVQLVGYGADEMEARLKLNSQVQLLKKELDSVQVVDLSAYLR